MSIANDKGESGGIIKVNDNVCILAGGMYIQQMPSKHHVLRMRNIIIINAIPLAICGMRCLYPISPIGETVPWPGKNPYSKPSIHCSIYIQFNKKTPFTAAPGR